MIRTYVGDWRLVAVRGLIALAFGVVALVWPELTLWALVVLWGAYVLADGVIALVAAFAGNVPQGRGWLVFHGLVGIAVGIVTFVWPAITGLVLLWMVAAWALVIGVMALVNAVRMRREIEHEWALAAAGVLAIALAAVLVFRPGAGALAVTWAIGWFAVVMGVLLLVLAWEVRREAHAAPPPQASARPGTPHPAT
jgi:uncharacterized membrane protein HdeD (DUF308 family)